MSLLKDNYSENMNEIIDETTYKKIPLTNRKKEIVDYSIVDNEDYERVIKYSWYCNIRKNKSGEYKYAKGYVNGQKILLSHYIIGKPENKSIIIDHININALDNRKINLHPTSRSNNSQNNIKNITNKTTSMYLGVSFDKECNKWMVSCKNIYLGRYDNEKDAALIYDKAVFILFGKNASTNGLIKFEDVHETSIDDLKPVKKEKKQDLPKNISITLNNRYCTTIIYNKKIYSKEFTLLEEAIKCLEEFNKEIDKVKQVEEKEHNNKRIIRNNNGQAIIYLYNNDKNIVGETIVDDDKWHHLMLYKWSFTSDKKYAHGYVNKKTVKLHRYLKNAEEDTLIDHVNGNSLDNRLENLVFSNNTNNNHNRKKKENTTSIFKGVCIVKGKVTNIYYASIQKNGKIDNLGCYETQEQAACAYNLRAKMLYGDHSSVNIINIDDELREKYNKEIIEKWKQSKKYFINDVIIEDA
jgi:gamma-glutamylcyclotransferase (GGCT)/AIG2-like uncharacterized protein YtfP